MTTMEWLRRHFWPAPVIEAIEANIEASRDLEDAATRLAHRMNGRLPEATAEDVACLFDRRKAKR